MGYSKARTRGILRLSMGYSKARTRGILRLRHGVF